MKTHLFILAALFALQASGQLKPIAYSDGTQKLNGLAIAPVKTTPAAPGILILPAWKGIDDHSKEVAQNLSKLGYHAFIADIYGEGNYPKTPEEAGKKSGYFKSNYKEYQRRIQLALDQLVKSGANAGNVAIIGYCFGGTGVLEAARAGMNAKGVVSFHGGLGKDASRENGPVQTKVLVLHGADDFYISKEDIAGFEKEMRDGKADWQMVYYADAVHAFTEKSAGNDKSKGAAYNEKADKRSWEHMKLFLNEILEK